MSTTPTSRRPVAPPSDRHDAPASSATSQRPARTDTPPRVNTTAQGEPMSWGKIIGFGVAGGLVVAGLAAAGMNLLG